MALVGPLQFDRLGSHSRSPRTFYLLTSLPTLLFQDPGE